MVPVHSRPHQTLVDGLILWSPEPSNGVFYAANNLQPTENQLSDCEAVIQPRCNDLGSPAVAHFAASHHLQMTPIVPCTPGNLFTKSFNTSDITCDIEFTEAGSPHHVRPVYTGPVDRSVE
jgi:hypothetical protein